MIKIRIWLIDNAENSSFYTVTYKIDKTAPQLALAPTAFTENTDYTYYGGRINNLTYAPTGTVVKYDSINDTFPIPGDNFPNPTINASLAQ